MLHTLFSFHQKKQQQQQKTEGETKIVISMIHMILFIAEHIAPPFKRLKYKLTVENVFFL